MNSESILKFSLIVALFLITFLYKTLINKLDLHLLRLGMFFTVLADFFLVALDFNTVGVTLFCMVQIIYIARYDINNFEYMIKLLSIIFMILFGAYLVLDYLYFNLDFIIPIVLFYSICLGSSIYKSIKATKIGIYTYPNKELIAVGMILFLLCDLNVALSYMGFMRELTSTLIWIFYIPSQFLLSISGYPFRAIIND